MRQPCTIAVFMAMLAASLSAEDKVVGGPYTVNVGQRVATIAWLVQTGEVTVTTEPGKVEKRAPALHAEYVGLTGLVPGKTYYYQSFDGEAGKGSFKTAPRDNQTPFQFVLYGDVRTRHDVHRSVIAAILKYANPDFVVQTGDLVEDGSDTSLWPVFFSIERDLLRKTAFFPAIGNHEHNARNYFDYLGAKPYYSFDWGGAHFSVLDSDRQNFAATEPEREAYWQQEVRWLETDLQSAQKADFRFVVAHHAPMTAVRRRQGENPHMIALEPLFEKYKVSAGLFGHDHNYQHFMKNGIHYVTSGGGGAPLYDVDTPPAGITVKVQSTENFVIVNVNGKQAHFEAKTLAGATIDRFDLP